MAQLPLKFSTSFYVNHATSTVSFLYNPQPPTLRPNLDYPNIEAFSSSLSSSSPSSQFIKDSIFSMNFITRFFRNFKRRKRDPNGNSSASSPSPRIHRFIACFSNVNHDAPVSDISYDSSLETKMDVFPVCEDSNEHEDNNAEEMQSETVEIIEFSAGVNDMNEDQNSGLDIASTFAESNVQGFGFFVSKLMKAMNNSGGQILMITAKDAKRKLEVIMVTVKQKGMEKVSALRRRNNEGDKLWDKPIIMGRRCRKIADNFPYGEDVALEFPRVSISSVCVNSADFLPTLSSSR